VGAFAGHIPCDADTWGRVIVPLPLVYIAVRDGPLAHAGLDEVDSCALERIAELAAAVSNVGVPGQGVSPLHYGGGDSALTKMLTKLVQNLFGY
jgi:hypothetical protein